ncbi:TetR family transcriptional regulator [Umezawaea tangerina]|uniref:TetR family transcriptional regulator n=1 Tax=Umezawaea tangerina TaxID=84725 RepID=A0A2T0T7L0_9PSEU|nr:TetR family transcriptional regulator [Umezawaea tangerina]PRY41634.1 TetR family transcriptional regulator [Umezawaea tangerina]
MAEPPSAEAAGGFPELFGVRIRELRRERRLTLRDLAAALEVSPATVSAIENGRTAVSVRRLATVARLFGMSIDALLMPVLAATESGDAPTAEPAANGEWRSFGSTPLDDVLLAASAAFLAIGYHGATVRDIASRAGLSVPGVYYHYESKQEMLLNIMDFTLTDLLWRAHAALDEADGEPLAGFRLLVECLVRYNVAQRDFAFLGLSESRALDEESLEQVHAKQVEIHELLVDQISRGTELGVFDKGDPAVTARAVVSMCSGLALWYTEHGLLTLDDVVERYVGFAIGIVTAGV